MADQPEDDERKGDAPDSGDPSEGSEDQPAGGNAPADEVEQTPDDKSAEERSDVAEASADDEQKSDEYGANRSDVDAMGNEKRRIVVGEQYGATRKKKLAIYGGVIAFIAVVVIAFLTVVRGYDNRDMPLTDTAPWTQAGASQEAPRDVDFKRNGPTDTIPTDEIVNR